MAQNLNQILWGEGVAFVDGKQLFEIQELGVNIGIGSITGEKGDGGGQIVEITSQPVTGRAGFLGVNAALLAALTGGSSSTGTVKRIRSEELTVATNAVTTSQTGIANTFLVKEKAANSQPLKQVSGAPSSDDEYQISAATTLTFKAGAFSDGDIIEVSYFYVDAANGETLDLAPDDLPDEFELYGSLRTRELFGGAKGDIIIYAAKCQRTSEIGLVGALGSFATPGFDFNIRRDGSGDFKLYLP